MNGSRSPVSTAISDCVMRLGFAARYGYSDLISLSDEVTIWVAVQDEPLRWGVAVEEPSADLEKLKAPGTTLPTRRRKRIR